MWLRLNNEQKRLAAEIAAKRFSCLPGMGSN